MAPLCRTGAPRPFCPAGRVRDQERAAFGHRRSEGWRVAVRVEVGLRGLEGRAFAVGLEWERVDIVVTELDPSDRRLDAYREHAQLL